MKKTPRLIVVGLINRALCLGRMLIITFTLAFITSADTLPKAGTDSWADSVSPQAADNHIVALATDGNDDDHAEVNTKVAVVTLPVYKSVDNVDSSGRFSTNAYAKFEADAVGDGRGTPLPRSIPLKRNRLLERETAVSPALFENKDLFMEDAARVTDKPKGEPVKPIQTSNDRNGYRGVRIEGHLLSVNVSDTSLLDLFDDLSKRCQIELIGKDVLSDKVITAKFHNVELEVGIKNLIRISGVENYALMYRNELGNPYAVSQIYFLQGEAETSHSRNYKKAPIEHGMVFPSDLSEDFPD